MSSYVSRATNDPRFTKIVDDFLKRAPASERHPKLVLMAGGYGAGKTTIRNRLQDGGVFPHDHYLVIDADEIRELLPRYQSLKTFGIPEAIAATRQDVATFAVKLLDRALQEKKNIIFDQSLQSADLMEPILRAHPEYEKILVHVDASPKAVQERVAQRGRETGREISPNDVRESRRNVASAVDELRNQVQATIRFKNDVEPTLVSITDRGKEVRFDQTLDSVLQKGWRFHADGISAAECLRTQLRSLNGK